MDAEALLSPQLDARYHGNRQADTTASKTPPAAEMIHTKTFAFRLAPATRLRNYPGRTNPNALGRCSPASLSMPYPATRRAPSGAPLRDATRAQPRAAGGRSADRHGPRTRKGPQGDDPPCGPSRRVRRAQKEKRPPRAIDLGSGYLSCCIAPGEVGCFYGCFESFAQSERRKKESSSGLARRRLTAFFEAICSVPLTYLYKGG